MKKSYLLLAATALIAGAAILWFVPARRNHSARRDRPGFVQTNGPQFVVDRKPFRFVGANIDLMFQLSTRAHLDEMMQFAADKEFKVIRVWVSGEGGPDDVQPFSKWKRDCWFRRKPDEWNEAEFVFLDRVIAEAAHHHIRVQLCLANWWRDTGGVTQYLRWAGIDGADDDRYPVGINVDKAMLFYTNVTARRLYREHLEKVATRRNTITGILYRDDPTIFAYELMNEAQCLTGRWGERRAWLAEMSAYLRSLDPDHLIAPGDWGYRSAAERREWLLDHQLPEIDYCDVHNYPRDDTDTFVDSPAALAQFIDNRSAAAFSIDKPLVIGEFGIAGEGYQNISQAEWYRAFFESSVRDAVSGAMFWILTPSPDRTYGIAYQSANNAAVFAEIKGGAHLFASLANAPPPPALLEASHHLIPRQFAFNQSENDATTIPQANFETGLLVYRFQPPMAASGRFEKIGGGTGYVWGTGAGYFEYVVPARNDHRRVGQIVVRAHLQPVPPADAKPAQIKTQVTLFIDGVNYGSRVVPVEDPKAPLTQEWRIDSWSLRLHAARGLPFTVRFEVTPQSEWLYGINISGWPVDGHGAAPVEVELN